MEKNTRRPRWRWRSEEDHTGMRKRTKDLQGEGRSSTSNWTNRLRWRWPDRGGDQGQKINRQRRGLEEDHPRMKTMDRRGPYREEDQGWRRGPTAQDEELKRTNQRWTGFVQENVVKCLQSTVNTKQPIDVGLPRRGLLQTNEEDEPPTTENWRGPHRKEDQGPKRTIPYGRSVFFWSYFDGNQRWTDFVLENVVKCLQSYRKNRKIHWWWWWAVVHWRIELLLLRGRRDRWSLLFISTKNLECIYFRRKRSTERPTEVCNQRSKLLIYVSELMKKIEKGRQQARLFMFED